MTPKLAAEVEAALRLGDAIRTVAMRLHVGRKYVEDIAAAMRLPKSGVSLATERLILGPDPLPAGCSISVAALPVLPCLQGAWL